MGVTSFLITDQLGFSGFHNFCGQYWVSRSQKLNEIQSLPNVKAINLVLILPWFCSRLRYWSWLCSWRATLTTGTPASRLPRSSPSATGTWTAGTSPPWTTPPRAPPYCESCRRQEQQRLFDSREAWWQQVPLVGVHLECVGSHVRVFHSHRTGTRRLFF